MSTYTHTVSNSDDIVSMDDVTDRIDEIEQELADQEDIAPDSPAALLSDEIEELQEELAVLKAFEQEGAGYDSLVRDSYFEEYARESIEGIEGIDTSRWPYTCIDWREAADELKTDYTPIDFDGVTYWAR